jgi:16S rRNA (cytosine967-C5)-methyltransferase
MLESPPSPPLHRQLAIVVEVVGGVVAEGRSLSELLPAIPPELRPGIQALTFHVLRRWGAASAARKALAPKSPPPVIDRLLTAALALLWPDPAGQPPYGDHTLVDQAVVCARRLSAPTAGFVNAVLRRFVREREACVAAVEATPEGRFNHPAWWIDRLQSDWPEQAARLLLQANLKPPMTLRINARRSTAAAYRERLVESGIVADQVDDPWVAAQALRLREPCPVQALPGFEDGDCSVQDASAQRAAPLLLKSMPAVVGRLPRVLDACAAPGGKAAHLLELADIDLLALDIDAARLQRVQDNLQRLRLQATLRVGDASKPDTWWSGEPFDAILVDAPCTASGIVRRHPDIRWLRRPDDVDRLAQVQAEMLDALWPLLAPGGSLLFATCSIFAAEGRLHRAAFLQRHGAGAEWSDAPGTGHLLPLSDNGAHAEPALHDGFFYALLRKPVP